jgi:hypothetical protein
MKRRLDRNQVGSLLVLAAGTLGCGAAVAQVTVSGPVGCQADNGPCSAGLHIEAAGVTAGPMTVAFGFDGQLEVVKNRPYQAQAVTEMKQTLADGSHIVQSSKATVARDSEGRTVRIQRLGALGPLMASGAAHDAGLTLTTIFDPVANTHTDYTSDNKTAHVISMPPMPPGPPAGGGVTTGGGFSVSSAGGMVVGTGPAMVGGGQSISQFGGPVAGKTEPLGTKTIEGVNVTGTRSISVIPTGAIGNEKDIAITHETWYSPDLKLVVQSTSDDPRFGQTTYSLTKLEQKESDAGLFQIPADYKVDRMPVFVTAPQ